MGTVLLVEDSIAQRQVITCLLRESGLAVTVASNGVEALKMLQTSHPDLIVLDIVMPKMNGYEFCRYLRGNSKTRNLPVLMCSAKGEDYDRYWALKQGADAYISKPFQPKELLLTVKQLIAK